MDDIRDYNPDNGSVLGRLLEELSWVGKTIKDYREGGRGFENVLTAEVFQALDFLPRRLFIGEIIRNAHGADTARMALYKEIENASFCLLPGNHYLIPSEKRHQTKLPVQPDGLIECSNVYCILEAKRIRTSSFMPEQLSREYVLTMRESKGRIPLLFLVIGEKPPVKVQKHGRKNIKEAINLYLDSVLKRAERHSFTKSELEEKIDEVVCWTTWNEISRLIKSQRKNLTINDPSIKNCILRVSDSIVDSIKWHA